MASVAFKYVPQPAMTTFAFCIYSCSLYQRGHEAAEVALHCVDQQAGDRRGQRVQLRGQPDYIHLSRQRIFIN